MGRALAGVRALPPLAPRLIDTREAELSKAPPGVSATLAALPETEARGAPAGAAFVIVTHDHALDFLIATEVLRRGDAAYVGMIGSATKRALFARHAAQHDVSADALVCPIAASAPRDKRPEAIAIFAAAEILAATLAHTAQDHAAKDGTA